MIKFIELNEKSNNIKNFYKGSRKNRKFTEYFFTFFMGVFASLVFQTLLYDIGAIPVLFNKELIKKLKKIPYDFTIETYVYYIAKKEDFKIIRLPVYIDERKEGISSWNRGVLSKIKQSWIIIKNLIKIRFQKI